MGLWNGPLPPGPWLTVFPNAGVSVKTGEDDKRGGSGLRSCGIERRGGKGCFCDAGVVERRITVSG